MISEIKKEIPKRNYPYLAEHKNERIIVLFVKPKFGICVYELDTDLVDVTIGEARNFDETEFEYFTGTVTLKND